MKNSWIKYILEKENFGEIAGQANRTG